MLQSLFPKENLNTTTLNPISTRKLKSVPDPDPTRYNHTLTRTKPTFGSGMYTSSTQKWEMCYYKSDLNVQILLKSAVKMREMPFQRHKFQKFPEGGMPPDPPSWTPPLVVRVPSLGRHIQVSPQVVNWLVTPVYPRLTCFVSCSRHSASSFVANSSDVIQISFSGGISPVSTLR